MTLSLVLFEEITLSIWIKTFRFFCRSILVNNVVVRNFSIIQLSMLIYQRSCTTKIHDILIYLSLYWFNVRQIVNTTKTKILTIRFWTSEKFQKCFYLSIQKKIYQRKISFNGKLFFDTLLWAQLSLTQWLVLILKLKTSTRRNKRKWISTVVTIADRLSCKKFYEQYYH